MASTNSSPSAPKRFVQTTDSPLIQDVIQGMSFPEAITHVIEGKRITRTEWDNPGTYLEISGEYLIIHEDNENHPILLRDGDLLGTDWEIV